MVCDCHRDLHVLSAKKNNLCIISLLHLKEFTCLPAVFHSGITKSGSLK